MKITTGWVPSVLCIVYSDEFLRDKAIDPSLGYSILDLKLSPYADSELTLRKTGKAWQISWEEWTKLSYTVKEELIEQRWAALVSRHLAWTFTRWYGTITVIEHEL